MCEEGCSVYETEWVNKWVSVLCPLTHNCKKGDREFGVTSSSVQSASSHVLPCSADCHCTSYPKCIITFCTRQIARAQLEPAWTRMSMRFIFSATAGSLFSGNMHFSSRHHGVIVALTILQFNINNPSSLLFAPGLYLFCPTFHKLPPSDSAVSFSEAAPWLLLAFVVMPLFSLAYVLWWM